MEESQIFSVYEPLGMMYLWCESPFYPGGEREIGVIDLTVQRDPITGIPHVRSTSIKGALRWFIENLASNKKLQLSPQKLFGDTKNMKRVGAVNIFDAEIVLFPVVSTLGLFAYITSPKQLNHWVEKLDVLEYEAAEKLDEDLSNVIGKLVNTNALSSQTSPLAGKKIALLKGEFLIEPQGCEELDNILKEITKTSTPIKNTSPLAGYSYIRSKVVEHTVVVDDDLFREIANQGLIRIVRIALDSETKVVKGRALFYQELIPQYTLLFCLIAKTIRYNTDKFITNSVDGFRRFLEKNPLISIGGGETTGKGQIRIVFWSPKS